MRGLVFVFICIVPVFGGITDEDISVEYLEPGALVDYKPAYNSIGFVANKLQIFCYAGRPKFLVHIFHTIYLNFNIDSNEFDQYEGSTPDMVFSHYKDHTSIFSFSFLASRRKQIKLSPFNQSCIGISTAQPYKVQLNLIRIDFWKIIMLVAGILTFFSAPKLCKNSLFYYLSGMLLGIFASFLVLVYLASKLMPTKPMTYGIMIGGSSLVIYFGQMVWENLQTLLVLHHLYVFWYVVTMGLISFIVCYRMGPPKNQRTINLIKWGLQLLGHGMTFFSTDFEEASAGIIILATIFFYFPRKWVTKSKGIWIKKFPPKRRLLSNEEYYEQGVRETTKALEELKQYCSSPNCKQWKTVLKLKSPQRFAEFIEGSSHIDDEEIMEYETSNAHFSEDESTEEDEEEQPRQPIRSPAMKNGGSFTNLGRNTQSLWTNSYRNAELSEDD